MPNVDVDSITLQIESDVTGAIEGLDLLVSTLDRVKKATENGCGLDKVANGVSKVRNATEKMESTNKRTAKSFSQQLAKLTAVTVALKRVGAAIASWISESTDYTESLNLFTVSMGKYADSAQEYANNVSDIMGIDPATWMKNQGVFMTLATGFGVASDRANTMSQQLTQLGYDLSSFFNISEEDAMQKLQSGISGELEPLRRLGYDLSQAKLEAVALSLGIDKAVGSMTQAEKAELRYYAIMTQVTSAQGDMARTLEAPANQLRILKAQVTQAARALGNIFIPALNAVLPYAVAALKVFRRLADAVSEFFGYTLPEIDYTGLGDFSSDVDAATDGLDDATSSAKKLKKTLLGIDELNVLSSGSGDGDTASGGSFDFELPTYDFLGAALEARVGEVQAMIEQTLGEITTIVGGFSLAVGAILLLTGVNVPLGLGLMSVGATGLGLSIIANWDSMGNQLVGTLSLITGAVSGFLVAIGAILTLSGGNVPLGIGLLAVGLASLAGSVAVNWHSSDSHITDALMSIEGILAGACLGVGAILAFSGVGVGLGIALMATGALSLASAVSVNWSSLVGQIESPLAKITQIVATGMLALGAILAFSGAPNLIPLGIALMGAGAVSLATTASLSWSSLSDNVRSTITAITSIVSVALLAVGAILALSGANIPLGIALLAGGALTLTSVVAMRWGALSDDVKATIASITKVVSLGLLAVGAILALSGVNILLGLALLAGGALGLASTKSVDWDNMNKSVKDTVARITASVSIGLLALGALLAFSGVGIPLGLALLAGGAAALVGAATLNWDSAKEPIRKTIASIASIISGALMVVGVLLILSGVGIGLGLAVLAAGLAGSYHAWSLDDNPITRFVKNMANSIIGIINWVIDAINDMFHIEFGGLTIWGKTIIPPFDKRLLYISHIPTFAGGGMVDSGQMFIAREAGPELVGSIGNRTAVANNDQIVEAVSQGVYRAVVQAMGQSSGDTTIEAKVNDKVLFEAVVNRARQETMRKGYNPLLGGV